MIRSFIAIDIANSQKEEIGRMTDALKYARTGVRWVRPENLHLTIKFLGSVDETGIEKIAEALAEITSQCAPFKIELKQIGAFSSLKRPDIIWIGITKTPALAALAAEIDERLSKMGIKKEDRPFSPHLTIARVKNLKGYDEIYEKLVSLSDRDFGICAVDEIALMKSELMPEGARYARMKSFRLSGN